MPLCFPCLSLSSFLFLFLSLFYFFSIFLPRLLPLYFISLTSLFPYQLLNQFTQVEIETHHVSWMLVLHLKKGLSNTQLIDPKQSFTRCYRHKHDSLFPLSVLLMSNIDYYRRFHLSADKPFNQTSLLRCLVQMGRHISIGPLLSALVCVFGAKDETIKTKHLYLDETLFH